MEPPAIAVVQWEAISHMTLSLVWPVQCPVALVLELLEIAHPVSIAITIMGSVSQPVQLTFMSTAISNAKNAQQTLVNAPCLLSTTPYNLSPLTTN